GGAAYVPQGPGVGVVPPPLPLVGECRSGKAVPRALVRGEDVTDPRRSVVDLRGARVLRRDPDRGGRKRGRRIAAGRIPTGDDDPDVAPHVIAARVVRGVGRTGDVGAVPREEVVDTRAPLVRERPRRVAGPGSGVG